MSWKNTQLKWYSGTNIQQDYDLQQFVTNQKISSIVYLSTTSNPLLNSVDVVPLKTLYVYIINQSEKISNIVSSCNQQLNKLLPGDFLYLAINKFLLEHETGIESVEDYDASIYNYIKLNVKSTIVEYHSGKVDGGRRFNWVHPLTRFYFSNANIVRNTNSN